MPRTRRQSIADALHAAPYTALGLARFLGVSVKTILTDLEHIRRSTRNRFILRAAGCGSCGYEFRDRNRLSTPSRCPRCKSEEIRAPEFHILH